MQGFGILGAMDVDRHNFDYALELVTEHLPRASFASLDLEFTGLGMQSRSQLDSPQRRYNIARQSAIEFPPCQFGLALFCPARRETYDADRPQYQWDVLPFNFWLCPRPVMKSHGAQFPLRDFEFKLQASSTEFLWKNGFDFNRMFGAGISWLRRDGEASIRSQLEEQMTSTDGRVRAVQLSQAETEWVKLNVIQELEDAFGTKSLGGNQGRSRMLARHSKARVRKYIFDYIRDHYPRLVTSVVPNFERSGGLMLLVEEVATAEEATQRWEHQKQADANTAISKIVDRHSGFRIVIDAMADAKIPIVVHNGLYDICKIYANFVGELPAQLGQFKQCVRETFPIVVDTKYLLDEGAVQRVPWVAQIMREKVFEDVGALETLDQKLGWALERQGLGRITLRPYMQLDSNNETDIGGDGKAVDHCRRAVGLFGSYFDMSADKYRHEAGYDAMVTGKVFLQLVGALTGQVHDPLGAVDARKSMDALIGHEMLVPLVNHLAVSSCGGYGALNLAAADLNAPESNKYKDRQDVVVVYGFRKYFESSGPRANASHADMFRLVAEVLSSTMLDSENCDLRRVADKDAILVELQRRPQERNEAPIETAVDLTAGFPAKTTSAEENTGKEESMRLGVEEQELCGAGSAGSGSNGRKGDASRKRPREDMDRTAATSFGPKYDRSPLSGEELEASLKRFYSAVKAKGLSVVSYDEAVDIERWKPDLCQAPSS